MKKILIGIVMILCFALCACGSTETGSSAEASSSAGSAAAWKARRARINTISPGVIVTPLAYDEFAAAGEGYQQMVDSSAAERCGTSDEIAEAGAFLLGEHAGFITGTDLLIDGGVIAAIRTGSYQLHAE